MNYKREELSKKLLMRCQKCHHGGRDIFPDCIEFDPTKNCIYFDDIFDDDPRQDDYDCGAYMSQKTYEELQRLT